MARAHKTTEPGWFTTAQVAELAGCEPATIRQRVADGRIPAPLRVDGRTYLWRADDPALLAWLATPRRPGRPRKGEGA